MDQYRDILFDVRDGVARITINRPEKYNAFTAETIEELIDAFRRGGYDKSVAVIVLGSAGDKAFCTGADQSAHEGAYEGRGTIGLPIDELQSLIRDVPKPVIARVQGFAIGGGNVLATLCDLTIASEKAVFGQVGPKVGSVDPGFGTAYLARLVGEKRAREIWYLCRRYTAKEAMGLDPKAFLAVAKGAASYSQVMETKGQKMLTREFSPEGRVKQTLKDVHMVVPWRSGALGSVRASMKNSLPTLALAMKHFSPLRIHSSPWRSARSFRPALGSSAGGSRLSEPAPGSLMPLPRRKVSSSRNGLRKRRFCSSVQVAAIRWLHFQHWLKVFEMALSALASSAMTSACVTKSVPWPPHSLGTAMLLPLALADRALIASEIV